MSTDLSAANAAAADTAPAKVSRAALWALGVIFAANFLNYTDRQLVSALEQPLRCLHGTRRSRSGPQRLPRPAYLPI